MVKKLLILLSISITTCVAKAQQKIGLNQALNKAAKVLKVKFTYEHSLVNGLTVSYDEALLKNGGLNKVLDKWLNGTNLTWDAIGEKYFTIIKKSGKNDLKVSAPVNQQIGYDGKGFNNGIISMPFSEAKQKSNQIELSGTITENKTGQILSQVTVSIKELGVTTMTDEAGRYLFRNLIGGKITVRAQFLTMVAKEKEIIVAPGKKYNLDFELDENVLDLKEVVVVAAEGKSGGATASIISQKAIEHLQATSLADVLQLLPGALATNPDFSNVNKTALRQISADNMGSLGTAVMINGSPVSNNANLQVLNPASAGANASFSTSSGAGTDLRQISADNIESIEVIRGVPSVEYGDLTNGAILVKTKAGQTPFQLKARINPTLNQLWAGKGFNLGKKAGNLNADIDYTKSYSDQRYAYDAYNRITSSLLYSNKFFKNQPLYTSTGFSFAKNMDELKQDPDDAKTQTENRAQDNAFRFNTSGRWNLSRKFAQVLNYNVSVNYAVQKGYQQSLVSNYIYPTSFATKDTTMAGIYVPSEYLSRVWVDGKPFNLFAKLTNSFYLKTGTFNHRFLVGGEWRTDANYGNGKTYDVTRPPRLSGNSASRPFAYSDIPALNQLSLYIEDHLTGAFLNRNLDIQAGLRYDNIQPKGLFKSGIDRVLAPRINLSYQIMDKLSIRGGYGITAKAPTLLYLYPQDAYFDFLNLNYYADNAAERLVVVTTRRFSSQNANLKIATNNKAEIGFDYTLFGNKKLQVTAYSEKIKNGYDFATTLQSALIIPITSYNVVSKPVGQPPVVEAGAVTNYVATYNLPTNNQSTKNRGVEFDLDLGRFDAIRTSFVLNGALLNTQTTSTGYYVVMRTTTGAAPAKIPIYNPGRGTEYTRASSTLRMIHNIPQAKLIITLAAQTIWIDKNKYLGYESIPIGYIQTNSGNTVWLTEAQRNSAAVINDNELNLNVQQQYYITESWKPLWLFNLRLTKEIGKSISFSFFANNVLMDRPLEESNRWAGQYSQRNPKLFFGTEISVKF
ncbi:TonB-dependent receptor [Pedobacter nototheniae]|uniref:TonB-dependent receptor n=1 Tax=Pedobacter nototheniae TaxID=2488994 RepID=UPI00103F2553|nr:TonB-dependent receptor [Pedobacter nototheniae]